MNYQDEAELKVQTQTMYKFGGVSNVLDCLIVMLKTQIIIAEKLKELVNHTGD